MSRRELQLKIWNAVSGYTLTQIENATPAQLANAANLTEDEIATAKHYKKLIMFRLIKAKKEAVRTTLKTDTVVPALQSLVTEVALALNVTRDKAKDELSRIIDDLQEGL